ncbi:MAG TPA: tetratricopeptide repeat protein [Burkholderiales bacterium]|nr:tetratricopeptide repeat protein [Burkholderiales bacterium]
MRVSATLLAVVLGVALPALADDLDDASKLLKAGQREQALERVNRVLAQKSGDPKARFLKGIILTEQGNTKDAIEIFTKLTQDYPNLPEPYNNLAVIYAGQGQYDKARTALEQSIRTHPSYATAYENLGDVYAKLASQAYDKALQLDKANTGAQNKLSLARELVGGPATAIAAAKEPAKPTVAAAVAEKPTEKPAAQAANPAEILKAVNEWAQAWSKKDVDAYLAAYAKDFKTPGGEARPDWEKTRRARIEAPKSIAVGIEQAKVTMAGNDQASVTFRQSYRSDKLKSSSRKTLVMTRADGRWLIREEKSP